MTTQNIFLPVRKIALSVAGVNILMMLAALTVRVWLSPHQGWEWLRGASISTVAIIVAVVVYSAVAWLILSRYPRHMLGWLFLIVGFFLAMVTVLGALQALEPTTRFGPFLGFIWWASHLVFLPAFVIPLSLVLLFFPDGRLPSRRWWPIAVATLFGMCSGALSIAFYPWPWNEIGIEDAHNPFAIQGSEGILTRTLQLSFLLMALGVFGSLAAVVVRFHRSQGIERLQMKWLVYIAVGGISSAIVLSPLLGVLVSYGLFLSLPSLMAIAIGIAILRYRLWDIDILIRRTLIYSTLTGSLALIYFSSVVVLQRVFPAESQISIVVSTLGIAALFSPLRRRIQTSIDRRFYRRKYDAEQTLAAFGTSLRDKVEFDDLTRELIATVGETVQPEFVSLWMTAGSALQEAE